MTKTLSEGMLKDIIEERKLKIDEFCTKRDLCRDCEGFELDNLIAETTQIVAREVLRKAMEGIQKKKFDTSLGIINQDEVIWNNAINQAIHYLYLQSLEENINIEVK